MNDNRIVPKKSFICLDYSRPRDQQTREAMYEYIPVLSSCFLMKCHEWQYLTPCDSMICEFAVPEFNGNSCCNTIGKKYMERMCGRIEVNMFKIEET